MSSFFTLPASQRKRKRADGAAAPGPKKRNTAAAEGSDGQRPGRKRAARDDSISGSDSEEEGGGHRGSDLEDDDEGSSDSEHEDETAAERRLRLAQRYLENIKEEVDDVGFDAADIDRDMIAERLKEDVAETKGRLYRRIASELDFETATHTQFRADTLTTTSIATCPPYAYTVSKDMTLIKWEILTPSVPNSAAAITTTSSSKSKSKRPPPPPRRRPKQVAYTKGNKNLSHDPTYQGHTDQILTVAASQDNKFVVTGGRDRKLIVWNAADLTPLRVFTQHRDAITGLAFRRGTNQLYSGSKDRSVKVWSLDELAYIETLFGHQDEVVDVAALSQERCVSVGARDRTARLWKIVDETQLVFRGGGSGPSEKRTKPPDSSNALTARYVENSIDRVAYVDDETFITGSDSGALSLWTLQKKKPVFTVPLAHGLCPQLSRDEAFSEQIPDPSLPLPPQTPRWITALATIPYSDLVLSGSWDGCVRVWRVSEDRRRLETVGVLGGGGGASSASSATFAATTTIGEDAGSATEPGTVKAAVPAIRGVVNDISIFERGDRAKDGICVVAAVGNENRLGRWMKVKGRNGAVVFEVGNKRKTDSIAPAGGAGEADGEN
ncbi:MAG: hypothetical protein M1819_002246 [Sarea resinae]|nr:MAG: hypothetical protein M1819_002246 [Sarea resinae]